MQCFEWIEYGLEAPECPVRIDSSGPGGLPRTRGQAEVLHRCLGRHIIPLTAGNLARNSLLGAVWPPSKPVCSPKTLGSSTRRGLRQPLDRALRRLVARRPAAEKRTTTVRGALRRRGGSTSCASGGACGGGSWRRAVGRRGIGSCRRGRCRSRCGSWLGGCSCGQNRA